MFTSMPSWDVMASRISWACVSNSTCALSPKDWISRVDFKPWRNKPVALVSAAAGRTGGARANYALRLAMTPFRARVLPGPDVLIAGAAREFDEDGRLTNERYLQALAELMEDLRIEASRVKTEGVGDQVAAE